MKLSGCSNSWSHLSVPVATCRTCDIPFPTYSTLSSFRLTLPQSRLFSGSTTSMVLPIEWSTWWRKRTNKIAQINEIKQEHQPLHLSPMRIIPNCSNVNKLPYAIVKTRSIHHKILKVQTKIRERLKKSGNWRCHIWQLFWIFLLLRTQFLCATKNSAQLL